MTHHPAALIPNSIQTPSRSVNTSMLSYYSSGSHYGDRSGPWQGRQPGGRSAESASTRTYISITEPT